MLQKLREKKSGLLVKIVLGIIVIGFSFFGIESYFVAGTDTGVASVGARKISQEEFRQRFNEFREQMVRRMGSAFNGEYFQKPEVRRQVLDQLVNEDVLLNANDKLGVAVPPASLRDEIAKVPAFQNDGSFDPDRYRSVLASQGMTPLGYEQSVQRDLAVRQLPLAVAMSSIVTNAQVDEYLRLKNQQRDFRYVKLDKPAADAKPVTDADVATYYKAHPKDFMIPERVAIAYIELDAAKVAADVKPDEATLKDRYEKEKSRFVSNEQRLASHILIKVGGNGSPADQKAALAKAEDIDKQAKSGKDFAELARKYSDDLGSRNQGGDLGWLEKGMTDQAFEGALFALDKGQISDPVLSPEGYHIIELRDIRPGKTRSFEEVKPELAREAADSEREGVYAEKSGKLTDLTYQDPSSLDPAAKALDLKVQTTPLFSRAGGTGIAANPDIVKAAFSDSVLVQGNNSDPIDLGPNHIAVVHVIEHKPAARQPLDKVRDEIHKRIVAERTASEAKARANALFASLGGGTDLPALAAREKLKLETERNIARDAANLDSALVKAAFEMTRPKDDKPVFKLVPLKDDAYALLQLDRVIDGSPTSLDAKTREAARTALQQAEATAAARDFIQALRNDSKVEINEDNM
ncbi:MAG: SurA N-terminal domain-containing protein [Rhodanobacteraceae bacterium]